MKAIQRAIKMELFSRKELDPDSSARQIKTLSEFDRGLLRPTRCDTSEPPRERFDPNDMSEPVRWLSQPGAYFQFKQSKPFRIEGFIHNRKRGELWTREREGGPLVAVLPKFPEPLFTTHWVLWFGWSLVESKGVDVLKRFVKEAFVASRSDYGYLALEEEQKSKNLLVTEDQRKTTTKFVGNDPEYGLPGLYWINVFGPVYTAWFGTALARVPAAIETVQGDSILVQFGDSPEDWRSEGVVESQRRTTEVLGRDRFFSLADPDRPRQTPFSAPGR